jgi:hypothetical protein
MTILRPNQAVQLHGGKLAGCAFTLTLPSTNQPFNNSTNQLINQPTTHPSPTPFTQFPGNKQDTPFVSLPAAFLYQYSCARLCRQWVRLHFFI